VGAGGKNKQKDRREGKTHLGVAYTKPRGLEAARRNEAAHQGFERKGKAKRKKKKKGAKSFVAFHQRKKGTGEKTAGTSVPGLGDGKRGTMEKKRNKTAQGKK